MKRNLNFLGHKIEVQETLLDRVIHYFSPMKGMQRFRARTMMAISGAYTGASTGKRSLTKWIARGDDADSSIQGDIALLRDRSSDLVRNAPLATGAINTVVTNVIGTGLRLQSRINRKVLGMSDEEADEWEANVEQEWALFSETQECDALRTLRFNGLADLAFRSTLERGDVFISMPSIARPGSPYRLKLQLIEADRVSNPQNKADSLTLVGGVEKDANGAPIRYHVLKNHPGNVTRASAREWEPIEAFGERTGRKNIVHLYRPLRPGQTRGVPYLAPVIDAFKNIDRYTDAEIAAAVVSAMLTVFIKSSTGDTGFAPMEPTDEVGGATDDKDFKLASGAIISLAPGEEVQTMNPGRPNTAFDPFITAVLRQVGVALELPFEILTKHFTSSYSAARGAMLEAWKFFHARRAWLSAYFCDPIYSTWMFEAVALGRVTAPGFLSDPLIRKAYLGAQWVGPSRGQIDELKEVQAAGKRIELGISTLSEVTAEMTGGDWEQKHQQSVKEKKMRDEDGLGESAKPPPSQTSPGQVMPPQVPTEDQKEE